MKTNVLINFLLLLVIVASTAIAGLGQGELPCTPRPAGMTGWWSGDGNAMDVQGSSHGTLQGGVAFTTLASGKVNRAFDLNGSGAYVDIADGKAVEVGTQLSITAWIKTNDLMNYRQIFSKFGGSGDWAYQIGLAPGGRLRTDISSNGSTYQSLETPDFSLTAGVWTHVALTFDAGLTRLYINGVQAASATLPFTTILSSGSTNPSIGRDPAGSQFFTGQIDEVALFNIPLAAHEIQAIYGSGSSGKCGSTRDHLMLLSHDGGNDSIKRYDASTHDFLGNLAFFGDTPVSYYGMVFDGANTLYVADYNSDRVMSYDIRTGATLGALDPTNTIGLDGPVGMSMGPDGKLYVADYSDRVLRYNFGTAAYEVFIPTGTVVDPYDVDFGPDGNVYVSDSVNDRILRYNASTGALMGTFATGGMDYPNFMTFRSDGFLYVSNYFLNTVSRYDAMTGAQGSQFVAYGGTGGATGIAFAPNGNLFLSDSEAIPEIKSFSGTSGSLLADITSGSLSVPHDLLLVPALCGPAPAGQVAFYTADGTPEDSAGFSEGTLANGAFYANGKSGSGAFSLDGRDDHVQINSTGHVQGQGQVSVEAWIRPRGQHDQNNGAAHDGVIYFESQVAPAESTRFVLAVNEGTGTVLFGGRDIDNGTLKTVSSTSAPPVHQWTHIAGVWEAGVGLRVYVNGALDGNLVDPTLAAFPATNSSYVGIGSNGGALGHFNGEIDEVSVYQTALSATDLGNVFKSGKGGKCRPTNVCTAPAGQMTSWWRAENNISDQIATNNGTPIDVSYAGGKVGQGFSLNGSSSRVEINESPNLNPEKGSFTVDAWFRTSVVSGTQYVISRYECGGTTCADSTYMIYLVNGQAIGYVRSQGATLSGVDGLTMQGTRIVADGQFHHVALQRDMMSNQARLYIDGTLEVQATLNPGSNGSITSEDFENDPIIIGAAHQATTGNRTGFFNGVIDEVGYFNRPLSQGEIQAVYSAGSGGRCLLPNLSAAVTGVPTTPVAGVPFTITATVDNTGFASASGVELTANLSPGLSLVSADAGCSFDAATRRVTCPIGPLANLLGRNNELLASASRQITVQPMAGGSKSITTTATATDGESVISNNLFSSNFVALGPTAAPVSVSGRITTADGQSIGNVIVTLAANGEPARTAITNPFGYYSFKGVTAGTTVFITVRSKRYEFSPDTREIFVMDELTDVDFIGEMNQGRR